VAYYMVGGILLNGSAAVPYQSVNLAPELEKLLLNSDARAGHSYTGIRTAGPMVRIVTPALKALLDLSGLGAVSLTSGSALSIFLIKHDAVGVASGNVHRRWTMTEGLLGLDSISTQEGYAAGTWEVDGVDDGTNAVWVMTDGVALPTQPRVTDCWFQGPLYLGSTAYRVEQSTLSPGQEKIKRHSNGDVGPRFVARKPAKPTIAVQAADGVLHGAAGSFGANVSNVLMFYRKGAEGSGLRVADATETHISVSMPSAFLTPEALDGTPGQEVGFGVMFDGRDDGTNALWTLDTTAAIAAPD
jgi:hypothetical protein